MHHIGGDNSASETNKGLRSRCDIGQDISFFEHEVSYLENEGDYCKQGAWLARAPFLAHNCRRKSVVRALHYIRTGG